MGVFKRVGMALNFYRTLLKNFEFNLNFDQLTVEEQSELSYLVSVFDLGQSFREYVFVAKNLL